MIQTNRSKQNRASNHHHPIPTGNLSRLTINLNGGSSQHRTMSSLYHPTINRSGGSNLHRNMLKHSMEHHMALHQFRIICSTDSPVDHVARSGISCVLSEYWLCL